MDTLGAFEVRGIEKDNIFFGKEFVVPARKNLTDTDRKELWNKRDSLIGKIIKYSYFPKGVKDLPRHPQFLGFRDKDDL